ncbi:hypothetical protein K1T71_014031 [Dendrolimus kikuchii]|uniref:Uncharacterized protein n=1 Tax=Dendrolimus kikuchii TaxID=765133 RepID=A0ACC1CET6_9NEOP|nr:hypothetical protein K1T71_014031 [Dendrolimus kikuchii]
MGGYKTDVVVFGARDLDDAMRTVEILTLVLVLVLFINEINTYAIIKHDKDKKLVSQKEIEGKGTKGCSQKSKEMEMRCNGKNKEIESNGCEEEESEEEKDDCGCEQGMKQDKSNKKDEKCDDNDKEQQKKQQLTKGKKSKGQKGNENKKKSKRRKHKM